MSVTPYDLMYSEKLLIKVKYVVVLVLIFLQLCVELPIFTDVASLSLYQCGY